MTWTTSPTLRLFASGLILSMIVPTVPIAPFVIGFFPCLPDDESRLMTLEDVQRCDLFAYAASVLALERAEEKSNVALDLYSVISIKGADSDANEILFNLFVNLNAVAEDISSDLFLDQIRGVIGPDDNYLLARQYGPILSNNLNVPMMAYGAKDDRLNQYNMFYRTLPSTVTLNSALLKLLDKFEWRRVGALSSTQSILREEMEGFAKLYNLNFKTSLTYLGPIKDLHSTLLDLHRIDLRIIVGFLTPEDARIVLCEASSSIYDLTTPNHVWILPAYYNPDWWREGVASYQGKLADVAKKTCSDQDMMDILNSVIFIDSVKFPTLDISIPDFYSQLLTRTRELFPNLDPKVNLEQFLQHSHATSAYDAAILLAKSLVPGTLEEIDYNILHSRMNCELCRLYSNCSTSEIHDFSCLNCSRLLTNRSTDNEITDALVPRSMESLVGYGQVLITQFINGTHCPMLLYWSTEQGSFISVHDLVNHSCSRQLGINGDNLFFNITHCPKDFYWKGRDSPPESNLATYSRIDAWALYFVTLLCIVGMAFALALIIFSIVFRKNVHVKSSSPMVNILILIGAFLSIPSPIPIGFILSSGYYDIDATSKAVTAICQLGLWLPRIGQTLFIGALLSKTWRLYRIFNNKSLKLQLHYLSDRVLIVFALLLVCPCVLVLIMWNAISLYNHQETPVETDDNRYVIVTYCSSSNEVVDGVMESILVVYTCVLISVTMFLAFITQRVPKPILKELIATKTAILFGTGPSVVLLVAEDLVKSNLLHYESLWWLYFVNEVIATVAILGILFAYQVYYVAKDYIVEVRKKRRSSTRMEQDSQIYYESLQTQIKELGECLKEKEEAISTLRADKEKRKQKESEV